MWAPWYFPTGGSQEWLEERDARLCVHLLQRLLRDNRPPYALEFGVWKAAWTSVILANVQTCIPDGIDPYPGLPEVRESALNRLASLGLMHRFSLSSDFNSYHKDRLFDLVHVDGEHSEAAVWKDLHNAYSVLAPLGVIVVDDINNYWHPGIASATYQFCERVDLRLFMTTGTKAYLARSQVARNLSMELQTEIPSLNVGLVAYESWGEAMGFPYWESGEVMGQTVLKIRDATTAVEGKSSGVAASQAG